MHFKIYMQYASNIYMYTLVIPCMHMFKLNSGILCSIHIFQKQQHYNLVSDVAIGSVIAIGSFISQRTSHSDYEVKYEFLSKKQAKNAIKIHFPYRIIQHF